MDQTIQPGSARQRTTGTDEPVEHEILALWLAPLISTLPLIPIFSIRSSPLFLGALEVAPNHPTTWPWFGPVISAMGIIFDGTILGGVAEIVIALPVYLVLRWFGKLSESRIVLLGIITAILASQFVGAAQNFKQPGLREFATSWLSPALACLSGAAAGLFVAYLRNSRIRLRESLLECGFLLPIASLVACAFTLGLSANIWRAH
jgi:hypothetical protein